MSEQSLISVIVPVYNVEKYLRPCVESILEQTYKNIEVILVNDGSTDKSKAICLELAEKDKRMKAKKFNLVRIYDFFRIARNKYFYRNLIEHLKMKEREKYVTIRNNIN